MEDQKNFILAIALSSLVMLAYFYFGANQSERMKEQADAQKVYEQTLEPPPEAKPVQPRDTVITSGQRIKIDSSSLSGSFLVDGSRFDDIRLKNYKQTLEADSETVIMLTPEGAEQAAYIFDNWMGPDQGTGANTPWSLVSGSTLTETTPIVMSHAGDGFTVTRTVSVDEHYLITLDDAVTNTSGQEITLTRKGVSRQHGLPKDLTNFFILQEGPIALIGGKKKDIKYSGLKKKKTVTETGDSGWVGLTDKYWLSANIPPQSKPMTTTFAYRLINDVEVYESAYALDAITLTPGTTIQSKGHIFVGAKDRDVLLNYQNNEEFGIAYMERAIDWGFLRILTRPMTWALSKLGHMTGNFGLGIMVLTLLIKIILFPLFNKQYESQVKMKKVQPKMKKLQTRYKDDRVKLQQEMMALYRKEKVNPAAGCLPVIPTIFVFFALYKSVFINVELRHAPFFGWIQDLSARDPLSILNGFGVFPWGGVPDGFLAFFAIGPLAILYGISMAAMYQIMPQPTSGASEQAAMQAKIFKFLPWVFMFILAPFATGLLVYWVWNNILSLGQQYYITRKFKVDTPVDAFFRKLKGQPEPEADD